MIGKRDAGRFGTLAAFHACHEQPCTSLDYGADWNPPGWPVSGLPREPWRVSYDRVSGEVYATPVSEAGPVYVLGRVVQGEGGWHEALDLILEGWADTAQTRRDIAWVRRRLGDRERVTRCLTQVHTIARLSRSRAAPEKTRGHLAAKAGQVTPVPA